ncbi:tryptophan synthase subunit beta [Candidatus Vidania fulgoroideorum]
MQYNYPDREGFFGKYGGSFIPNFMYEKTNNIYKNYIYYKKKNFLNEVYKEIKKFSRRPSLIYFAKNLSYKYKNNFFFKREDLNFTNSHKINNTIGQMLLAIKMGKKEIVAETGAGQHGLSVASICSYYNVKCIIFMGYNDYKKQINNYKKMKFLGAKVFIVKKGNKDLKEAIDEAIMYWMKNKKSYYLVGSVVGPHPYPLMVRDFQKIIGKECFDEIKKLSIKIDYFLACIGGGSNCIGFFYNFIKKRYKSNLIGVEACGKNKKNSVFKKGKISVINGCKTLVLKKNKKLVNLKSISSGLNYPSVGPEHCFLYKKQIVNYKCVDNKNSKKAFFEFSKIEGIIPSIESSHAIYQAIKTSKKNKNKNFLINLSGSGEKDLRLIK